MPLATDFFRERFRAERQMLARLTHPYIARLLDGGVTEQGELYLVMELVEGVSITEFCTAAGLDDRRSRLLLFQKVCEAVQYAHRNLIVHRDLKPDNILVMEDSTPRLLDFGTAKMIQPLLGGACSGRHPPGHAGVHAALRQSRAGAGPPDIDRLGYLLARRSALCAA